MFFFLLALNLNIFFFCVVLLLLVAFLVLIERKLLSLIQERKGPNVVGFFSLVQTVMDSVKLLLKKNYFSYSSFYFLLLPMFGLFISFSHFLVVPVPFVFLGSDYTVLLSFVLMSLLVYVVLSCGYVSSSSYSIISSVRAVAQMISYEVVFMLYILSFMFLLGSYSWKSFLMMNLIDYSFYKFFFFFILVVISVAELNRTPFDLVEGESELVSGFNVEYSSYGFTLLFLSEYMNIWFMGVLFSFIFMPNFFWFFLGVIFFVFLVVYIRGLLPRFKFSQLINLMWKVFLPFLFVFLMFYIFLVF